ncbi:MAG: UDP-3-O-[3-hydroxymyristoyl] glucosamine N-acyltransferase [Arenicella sp.]|jgi:UDP-3-O-[3-hydroxymyristoyl] glucosamine N-acyltransferase
MSHSAQQLCDSFAEIVIESCNTNISFETIDGVQDFSQHSLIFVSDPKSLDLSTGPKPAVLVTSPKIAQSINHDSLCVITVGDVRLAQALIKQHYCDYDAADAEWDAIHPSAVIHPSAELGNNVRIGANVVIGADVIIGDNTIIRANSVIEHGVAIGSDTIVNSLVNIGYACRIGSRVIIRPGVIIGNEGFGFAQDKTKRYHRVPHTGIVEVHDDVQIGSNCNIDRATYGKTIIQRGVKIDALCHVAHNVLIDEDTILVAQSGLAGSCTIGKRVVISGQTAVLDHKSVVDDAVLVHRCGVTSDITTPGMWAGTPPKLFKDYVRHLNVDKRVEQLSKRIDKLTELGKEPSS